MNENRLPEDRNGRSASPPPPANRVNGHANAAAGPLPPSADGTPPAGKDPATGRFLPGNKLGQGNPHYRKLAENRTAFLQTVGPEQIRQVTARLLRSALTGDIDAARLLIAYAIGRPGEAVNPDRTDLDELGLMLAQPFKAQLLAHMLYGVDPAAALAYLRHMAACREPSAAMISAGCEDGTYAMKQLTIFLEKRAEARAKQV